LLILSFPLSTATAYSKCAKAYHQPFLWSIRPSSARSLFPGVNHRFNADYKSFLHFWSCSLLTPVSNFRLFVEFSSKPMTNQFSDYRVSSAFRFGLNCVRDVSNPVSGNRFLNPFLKRSSGIIEQPSTSLVISPTGKVNALSPYHPLILLRNQLILCHLFKDIAGWNTMNHFVVDRCTECIRKTTISLESRSCSIIEDKRFGYTIEIKSGNPGFIIEAISASVLDTSILLSFNNPTSSSVFKYNIKER